MRQLDQPPPGPDHLEELPPPGWRGMSTRQFWMMMVVGSVMLALVTLVVNAVFRGNHRHCNHSRAQAINNAKQVGLALLEFDQEYGSFPNAATAALVETDTGTALDLSGNSSNAMFRQLIAYGIQSEDIFFALHSEGSRRSDRDLSPGKVLNAGEVGFSYVAGLDTRMNPGIPVLMTPMRTGTEEFLPDEYQGKAVILRLDLSAECPLIRGSDRKVSVGGGKSLFQTGLHTVWPAGRAVDLRHPEF